MMISNCHFNNVAIHIKALPPQHQNLAPPTTNSTGGDSVLLSLNTSNSKSTHGVLPPATNSAAELAPNKSHNSINKIKSSAINNAAELKTNAPDKEPTHTSDDCLSAAEQNVKSPNSPTTYSAAASASCAFSSEAAPALLFQEDFSAGWQLGSSDVSNLPSKPERPTTPAENSEHLSAVETDRLTAVEPDISSAAITNRSIIAEAAAASGGRTKATESSSSTRSKTETKKAPQTETPLSQAEEQALKEEKEQQEKQRVEVIYDRIKADKLLHEAKRQAIWADLQTELRRIWRDVMLRRKKSEDDYQKNWQKIFLNAG